MWSFLFISNHLQASGWELASSLPFAKPLHSGLLMARACQPTPAQESLTNRLNPIVGHGLGLMNSFEHARSRETSERNPFSVADQDLHTLRNREGAWS